MKWAVLMCKMGRFGGRYFVNKLQLLRFQSFMTIAKFARTSPSGFYFSAMALSEAKNELFVNIIQKSEKPELRHETEPQALKPSYIVGDETTIFALSLL